MERARIRAACAAAAIACLAALVAVAPAAADFPYTRAGADPTNPNDLYLGAGQAPGDLSGKETWMYAATPEAGNDAVNNDPAELGGVRGAHLVDSATGPATAWQLSTGRPDVTIAVLDSGIKWDDAGAMRNIRRKTRISRGEVPKPRNHGLAQPNEPGAKCGASGPYDEPGYDLNGDGAFDVVDYACDNRVDIAPARGVGPKSGEARLDPQDVLIAFSDGTDADGNGFVDDIVGWDFLDDDNDPYDDVQYGHGTGEANDSVAEAENGQGGAGTCPNCMAIHMRVGDSFVADVNRFAAATNYAVDNGALVIQEALGTVNNSRLAREAVEYAYRHGVTVIASAADEAAQHNNWPSSLPHVIMVNSVTRYSEFADPGDVGLPSEPNPFTEQPRSYLKFNGCTNFYSKMSVAIPSVSCSSDATGRAAGMAGLIYSAALTANELGKLAGHPSCRRVAGAPGPGSGSCVITPNEVRQLMASGAFNGTPAADDVDFTTIEGSCSPLPLPGCTDPTLNALPPAPTVTLTPSRRYPARAGFDQFYGYGRVNMARAIGALIQGNRQDAGATSRIPPEVEITSPEWFDQLNPGQATFALNGELFARGAAYTCRVYVAPGHYPNNARTGDLPAGDFGPIPSAHCNGSARTGEFAGKLADVDVAALRARFPIDAGDFNGRESGTTGIQTSGGRPNTAPYGFTLRVVAESVAGGVTLRGEDRRSAYLHRDQDMLPGFPLKHSADGASSPLFADLDGDNRNELVIATSDGFVHAYTYDPAAGAVGELGGWPVRGELPGIVGNHAASRAYGDGGVGTDLGGSFLSGLSAGDMNRDGVPEVYAADIEGQIYGWEPDGSPVFRAESNPDYSGRPLAPFENVRRGSRNRTQRAFVSAPVLADLDGDDGGKLELVIAGMDRHLYAFNHDGSDVSGFPVLVVDHSKVDSIDPETHAVTFNADAGPALDQGAIVDTPAVGDISGDGRPEILIGTNEEYAIDAGNEGPHNVAPDSALFSPLLGATGLLDLGNSRLYAIKADGDPDEPAAGASPFVAGWPRPIAQLMTEVLPIVGEGITGSPVIAPLDCPSGGAGPKIGVMPAAGYPYIFNPSGISCYGRSDGLDRVLGTEIAVSAGKIDTPVFAAVGLPAFADLGLGSPSLIGPVAGVIRALDLALNEYQVGGQDFVAAWDTSSGQLQLGWPRQVNDLQFLTGPAAADITGDGSDEVIAGTASMDLQAFGSLGLPPNERWPKLTTDWTVATPLLGSFGTRDTAGDARRLVVNLTRSGYVNVYRTAAHPCASASWPRFHHDNASSGDYRRDAVLPGVPTGLALGEDGRLTFAAPGDDLLCGRVAKLEVVTSDQPIDGTNFGEGDGIGSPDVVGPGETASVALPADAGRYLAVRAVDEQGNVGRVAMLDTGSGNGGGNGDGGGGGGDDDGGTGGGDGDPKPGEPKPADPRRGDCSDNRIIGTDADDRLAGSKLPELLLGRRGDDRLAGRGANDCLKGGPGEDELRGGRGSDELRGGPGDDVLRGGKGRDKINCGRGRDVAHAGKGDKVARSCETVKRRRR